MDYKKTIISLLTLGLLLQVANLASALTMKVYPTEDVFVQNPDASQNYNDVSNEGDLKVGHSISRGKQRSFLKFDLTQFNGDEINSMTFSIDPIIQIGTPTVEIHDVQTNSWNENTLTWNNAPSIGSLVDSKIITSGERVNFNIQSLFDAQEISIAMTSPQETSSNEHYVAFFSNKEANFEKPYVEIDYTEGTGENPTCDIEADNDCNGCVDLIEMVGEMLDYKEGRSELDLLAMVNLMLQYKGGEISC